MIIRRWPSLCVIVLAFGVFGRSAVQDPRQIYDQSTDALYNLDFDNAQRGYEKLVHDYSDNPDYWNAMASSIWLKIAFDQQKLNVESFSATDHFGSKESSNTVNPADEKRLRDTITAAIVRADAILKQNPNNVRALYAKGTSNAVLASFEATIKRSYYAAHSDAKAARDLHQQVLDIDPNYTDARLSIGAYDYVIGSIPPFFRILIAPFGIHSAGKDVGIQELETVAAKGAMAAVDAKILLWVVYVREKRYDDAIRLLNELHGKYPRNFSFELAEASTYGKMRNYSEANRIYGQILLKVQKKTDGYDRLRQAKVYDALAESEIDGHQFEEAIGSYTHVVSSSDASVNEKADAYLWLGKLYDSKNQRAKALQQYNAVLTLDCNPELKTEALKYKSRAFGR